MHPYTLKACSGSICRPLTLLFNQSLQSGCLPQYWKYANVIPVFKKGAKSIANKHRPISLISQVVKVFESIVCDNVLTHYNHKLFSSKPTWFLPKKSYLTNLLESYNDWIQLADNGSVLDTVFLDYKKCFDRVPIKD